MQKELTKENRAIQKTLNKMAEEGKLTGIYSDIPNEVYHHPETVGYSSTTLKRIIERNYNHWFFKKEDGSNDGLSIGSAFHLFQESPEEFKNTYKICTESSKNNSEYKSLVKNNPDKIILTYDEYQLISSMDAKLAAHPDAERLMSGSNREHTFFAQDEETGLWLKCKSDLYNPNNFSVSDYKTCANASESAFTYDAKKYLYRISAAHYLNVISKVTGIIHRDFYMIACEKEAPNDVAVYRVDERSIMKAEEEIRSALNKIKEITTKGADAWGGYVLGCKDILI